MKQEMSLVMWWDLWMFHDLQPPVDVIKTVRQMGYSVDPKDVGETKRKLMGLVEIDRRWLAMPPEPNFVPEIQ